MRSAALLLGLSLCLGCGSSARPVIQGDGDDSVVRVASDDPGMKAAISKARETSQQFITVLGAPQPNQSGLSVKQAVQDGEHTEHFWLSDVEFRDGRFYGNIANDPQLVHNVSFGQATSVAPGEISDWMYVEDGKLVGGYTIRAMRDAMSPEERQELDAGLPFTID